jgi:ADP-heptose:LPS heptosyltransferase
VGFAPQPAEGFIAWPRRGTEVERLLALTDHLGAPRCGTQLDFPLRDHDRELAERLCLPLRNERFALVHPGAQLPSRRWPPERFAAVADSLAREGLAIVLTGSPAEAPLTRAVAAAMKAPALDLAGRTSLWTLGALVEWAAQVVCNDTGISHVAAALGTPSVVISSGGDALRWAPSDRTRHQVLWHDLPCRPCAHRVCPNGQACALGVGVGEVRTLALAALRSKVTEAAGGASIHA